MDVRRLELLRELSDRGSITAVAAATHRTASAVSQQLKVLEREVGMPLTEPSGRGIKLTVAGRALAQTATDIAVAIARAEATWREFVDQPAGEVTVTTFPTAGEMLLPGMLQAVADVPNLVVTCTDQDPLVPDFADLTPDFDIVIADSPLTSMTWHDRGLTVVPLLTEPLDIALPEGHRLASKASLTPSDVVGERWIGVPHDFPYDRILRQIQSATGQRADVVQRIGDNGIVEALVAAGRGIAILPRFTTRDHGNGLITRPLVGIRSKREISALLRPDRFERPSVRLVLQALRDEARHVGDTHNSLV
ncbi:LysR family transcriptional regulator [soil metagenome]